MFEELMPLLTQRVLVVTLSRVSADEICINVIPKPLKSDQQDVDAALSTPLSVTGTPKQLDEQLPRQLRDFVETHLGLSSTLKSAKEQMEAAKLSEQERNQTEAGREGAIQQLFLIGDYEAAASIPIGATLAHLEAEHDLLPAAFYQIFTTNLYKWMRVYDYVDAQEYAEMWMEDLDEEELKASVYQKVDLEIPDCIKRHWKTLRHNRARHLLREIRPRTTVARQLIRLVLEMDAQGQGYEHAWPGYLREKDVPGVGDWLMDAASSRPGCLITWYENDAINACFDEEAQHMGENGPCQPNVAIPIQLDQPTKKLDEQVRRVFDHVGAMLRSLAVAAKIVEIIRELYDEYLREHRLQPGLPAEPGAAGVRDE